MPDLPDCLPVPPTLRRFEAIEITYCIERRADHLWHQHIALYDADRLIVDRCTLDDDPVPISIPIAAWLASQGTGT